MKGELDLMKSEKKEKKEVINEEREEVNQDKPKEQNDEFEKIKKELEDSKNFLLRTAAEYDNFRKRSEREKDAIYSNAICSAVESILPLADSFEAASKTAEKQNEEYLKGIELLRNQFDKALKSLNVESFGEIEDEFDPNIHHAISHIETEDERQNFVSGVFQKGYKIGDKIVRHAVVQVTN